ncbi:winged helix-turn-helix domain-containing protein [Altererythrobacter arenosus]|uniref:Winged helix-turn-helix domain-containing protein n=1 Tax=Altererythrobacter arenosus TaxID=3032592 RepID=A0ABY8FYS8_9SPHN|nr:winged helix-turn-helix domain-containing protein [Altererythrobacter sp. CAU 1644]WFL77164.1 winged helix-turn-helix domain-containing protein [Altererythrobacter sp. CAU 1644]
MPSDVVLYRFDRFELDPARFELREGGVPVQIEPQVLSLLLLLVANAERMVDKDELIEKVWGGRIVSETAVSSRIKSARQAIGDDGKAQRLIRTVHGRGFRFVGKLETELRQQRGQWETAPTRDAPLAEHETTRPSIAVLPFRIVGEPGRFDFMAAALPDELITDLARLRYLFVIARGSSFRFNSGDADFAAVGTTLKVRYILSGSVETAGSDVIIRVELSDVRSGGVIWNERYRGAADEASHLRETILGSVIANVEQRIPMHEAQRARLLPDTQLDAWSAYHLGLDHMFRFNGADNQRAAVLFARAVDQDPHFARAYGGLSFTHFQNAFLHGAVDRDREVAAAKAFAERAVQTDSLDPFAHFNLGRTHWLEGDLRASITSLEHSTVLSPNYAQGVYAKAWAETLAGESEAGDKDAALALELSPLDPLRFAMVATRAFAHMTSGNTEAGAELGEQAANTPGAHRHIKLIAAIGAHLNGEPDKAQAWLARSRQSVEPSAAEFLQAFPFSEGPAREVIERALRDLGL